MDLAFLIVEALKGEEDEEADLSDLVRSLARANRPSLEWVFKRIDELKKVREREPKTVTVTVKVE